MTNSELIESFSEMCGGNRECMVSNASKTLLLQLGLKSSKQRIVVRRGRWSGLEAPISYINWPEGEVRVDFKGCHRYFSAWTSDFLVAGPTWTSEADKESKLSGKTPESAGPEDIEVQKPSMESLFQF